MSNDVQKHRGRKGAAAQEQADLGHLRQQQHAPACSLELGQEHMQQRHFTRGLHQSVHFRLGGSPCLRVAGLKVRDQVGMIAGLCASKPAQRVTRIAMVA